MPRSKELENVILKRQFYTNKKSRNERLFKESVLRSGNILTSPKAESECDHHSNGSYAILSSTFLCGYGLIYCTIRGSNL